MDEAGGRRNANVSREPGRAFRRAQGTSDGDEGSQKHLRLFYRIRLQNPTPSFKFLNEILPRGGTSQREGRPGPVSGQGLPPDEEVFGRIDMRPSEPGRGAHKGEGYRFR